ncbi:putative ABC transport system ATP-binding protein [Murinocardiopsis flavida]|uniref:Putative ABC transport system ATP-binding protein n=1 Tax=Murinocardiopsis flavida TaxID=645275 RepID=A0A2P8CZU5_9ACTN|nr:ABC transporter ATP-binding protein [Murinocardiopsis flavida]PSK90491.1 putative ABC transport system ATP-binding protein [Murinocardiopsis flavida]
MTADALVDGRPDRVGHEGGDTEAPLGEWTPGAVIRRALRGRRALLSGSAALMVSHQAGEAMVPVLVGVVIDQALGERSTAGLGLGLGALAAAFLLLSFSYKYGSRLGVQAAQYAEHDLRGEVAARVLHPRGGAEDGRTSGALLSVATSDAQRVASVALVVAMSAAAASAFTVAVVSLLLISVPLGLLVVVGLPPVLLLSHLLGRPLERRGRAEQARVARAAGLAADLVRGLRALKGIGAERAAADRYVGASRGSLRATLSAARAEAAVESIAPLTVGAFLALVAYVGGVFAIDERITVGQLISAVGLAQFLTSPMERFAVMRSLYAQVRASAGRVADVLGAPTAVGAGDGSAVPAGARGEVRVDGLHHGALNGLSLHVPAGSLVGVAAPDQAAAAALLDCLGRRCEPASGSVLLDGVPLVGLAPGDAHAAVLIGDHDADLFEGTVRENLAGAADPAEDRAGVRDAAVAAAAVDEVAASLPAGLDTVISERGRSLSGGQRQRVALARALAADPVVLVLHEPTSAIDSVTEARVAEGLRAVRHGRSTVLVTTSPALLAVCDRVVLLDAGTAAAEGTHADLVADDPRYRETVLT